MSEKFCPNCGHPLFDYRLDRQPVGVREVVLQWTMCGSCRHVGLKRWEFAPGVRPDATPSDLDGHTPGATGRVRELQYAER